MEPMTATSSAIIQSGYISLMQAKKKEGKDSVRFIQKTDAVMEVILDNKKKMNFLTLNMLYTLLDKLVQWDREPEKAPSVIIMSGAGETAFCSGGDMRGLYDAYI